MTDHRDDDDIERVFREVYGHAVASLVGLLGSINAAEDAVQDAFVIAADRWPDRGVPANPHGWIVTTARRRAIDTFRRRTRGAELERSTTTASEAATPLLSTGDTESNDLTTAVGTVVDDRLRLIFTCCHPALRTEHQIALTLRLLGGLTVAEIARSFLVSEVAMAKRLTRAKYKITAANIPYRVPTVAELPDRVEPVLSVISLIYNTGADALDDRATLRSEGIRLARAIVELLPTDPEAAGLLALLILNEARMPARRDDGRVVLLRDQDRTRWRRDHIDEGQAIVRACVALDRPGPFQLQAAIQAVHCDAERFEWTDWRSILQLYDHLWSILPTPIVGLNRAIVVMETDGTEAALEQLRRLSPALDGYAPFHAATAAAHRRSGDIPEAISAFERALALVTAGPERDHVREQIDALSAADEPSDGAHR